MIHYTRREQIFLDWLTGRQDLNIIHFQEYTTLATPPVLPQTPPRGLAIVLTVHNIFAHRTIIIIIFINLLKFIS